MRSFIFVLFTTLFSFQAFAENRITPTIKEVTVYRSGAKISSVATVKVPAGNSEIVFENLSPYFNPNSLQVRIKGAATLNAAVFSLNVPGPGPESPRAPIIRDSLVLLGDALSGIMDEREVLANEITMMANKLNQIGVTTPTQNTTTLTVAELKELTTFYRQRQMEVKERLQQLTIKERKINELYQSLQLILQRLQPNVSNSTGQIVMKIESTGAQSIEIVCTYLVTQAGWSPLYDLRSEGFGKPLRLIYKANVRNLSGFDWKSIVLHLSTANPLANNDRHILTPVFVDFRPVYTYYDDVKRKQEQVYQMAPSTNMAQVKDMARSGSGPGRDDAEVAVMDLLIPPANPEPQGNEDLITNFDVAKPQDIQANGLDNIITVDEQDMPAEYEYHAVPKLDPSVFLLAKVPEYGKYNLLPGLANIFYQDTYVGQTSVNPFTVSDTLLLSLGKDDQITIKRMQPKDFTEKKKVFSNMVKETFSFEIVVKNNKSVPVNIEILDQVPVSKQKDITVELEDKAGAEYNEDYGKLKWELEIPANQSKRVRFTYSIKYPKDKAIGMFRQ
ncbi:MAG: DUF4139 domain-containing protein [Saprospiraceae bacterium]|nr:DUF4139 domain-containing protein [Saprospiraceae bacterium]